MIIPTTKPWLNWEVRVVNKSEPINDRWHWARMPVIRTKATVNIPTVLCDNVINYINNNISVNDWDIIPIGNDWIYYGTNAMWVATWNMFRVLQAWMYHLKINISTAGTPAVFSVEIAVLKNWTTMSEKIVAFRQSWAWDIIINWEAYLTFDANDEIRFMINVSWDTTTNILGRIDWWASSFYLKKM